MALARQKYTHQIMIYILWYIYFYLGAERKARIGESREDKIDLYNNLHYFSSFPFLLNKQRQVRGQWAGLIDFKEESSPPHNGALNLSPSSFKISNLMIVLFNYIISRLLSMGAREIFVSFIMRLFKMMIIFDSRKAGRNEEFNIWLVKAEKGRKYCLISIF